MMFSAGMRIGLMFYGVAEPIYHLGIADTAGGYAALTLAPEDREVLTVEYKINFLAAAWERSSWPAGRS